MRRIKLDVIIMDKLGIADSGPLKDTTGDPITMRRAIITHCGMFETSNGEEAIHAFDLGIKIKNAGPTISVEDADYKFLKDKTLGQPKYVSMIMAQVLKEFHDAETVKPEEKK